jgi:hypothetical protein
VAKNELADLIFSDAAFADLSLTYNRERELRRAALRAALPKLPLELNSKAGECAFLVGSRALGYDVPTSDVDIVLAFQKFPSGKHISLQTHLVDGLRINIRAVAVGARPLSLQDMTRLNSAQPIGEPVRMTGIEIVLSEHSRAQMATMVKTDPFCAGLNNACRNRSGDVKYGRGGLFDIQVLSLLWKWTCLSYGNGAAASAAAAQVSLARLRFFLGIVRLHFHEKNGLPICNTDALRLYEIPWFFSRDVAREMMNATRVQVADRLPSEFRFDLS